MRWLTFTQYAKLSGQAIAETIKAAKCGELGKIEKHPRSGDEIVIWPKEKQGTKEAEALKLGMSNWAVTLGRPTKELVSFDAGDPKSLAKIRRHLIFMGRKVLDDPYAVFSEAKQLSIRSAYLNLWSTFESFLRETIAELVQRFPSSLAKLPNGKRPALSYEDIVEQSLGFSSVQALRDAIIAEEIAKVELGGQSIHGLINLLKSNFKWQNELYESVYTVKGKELTTSYSDLMEIKEVRNLLTHQSAANVSSLQKYERLQIIDENIVLDGEYLDWANLVLTSVAHGIAESIITGGIAEK